MKIFVFQKEISLFRGETREIVFTPEEFPQLKIDNPRLWWPLFKGKPDLYELKMTVSVKGQVSDSLKTRFGIREITSDQNTPDKSRQFYVNARRSLSGERTGYRKECCGIRMNVLMQNCAIQNNPVST